MSATDVERVDVCDAQTRFARRQRSRDGGTPDADSPVVLCCVERSFVHAKVYFTVSAE